jgi:serine/threonine protein kinase
MPLAPGARLGPYEILAAIGAGGMGEVYRARDTRLDRTVAIKVLPAEISGDPDPSAGSGSSRAKSRDDRRVRFEREARAIASLSHPHICTLHDIGTHDGTTYLVMEHLTGESLAERLIRGPVPLAQALDIAAEIAEALDAAHKHGIIHRDLKPGNVMLTSGGAGRSGVTSAKLLDFGLAKLAAAAGATGSVSSLTDNGSTQFAVSRTGTLVFVPGGSTTHAAVLKGVGKNGKTQSPALSPAAYQRVRLSPDGRAAAVDVDGANASLWILDCERSAMTRLTLEWNNNGPDWSPDGSHIVFNSAESGLLSPIGVVLNRFEELKAKVPGGVAK